mmetsp:Transcript_82081/g.266013  ORF Transcript_82081/g.266013 Transcript_82081/m.266013 type:complete len:394 (+) Transcript_82081:46-1227(+)
MAMLAGPVAMPQMAGPPMAMAARPFYPGSGGPVPGAMPMVGACPPAGYMPAPGAMPVAGPVMQPPSYVPPMAAGAPGGMMTARSPAQNFSYMPGAAGAGTTVHAPVRVAALPQPFPPGARVRMKGVAANSPFAGSVLVVTSEPDRSGQLRLQPEGAGPGTALLLSPAMLESADTAPAPQPAPAPPPVAWLEGGCAEGQSGLRPGDQVRLRGQAANRQYEGKALIVEAADVGDGTGRVRVVVQHETHVSRLALDPAHLELVAEANAPEAMAAYGAPGVAYDSGAMVYATMPAAAPGVQVAYDAGYAQQVAYEPGPVAYDPGFAAQTGMAMAMQPGQVVYDAGFVGQTGVAMEPGQVVYEAGYASQVPYEVAYATQPGVVMAQPGQVMAGMPPSY